jgi:hypothetical protein
LPFNSASDAFELHPDVRSYGQLITLRSILVGSNLRRAVATIAIGFWDRIARTREKIIVHSALQEMARNVDAYAIARRGEAVPLDGVEAKIGGGETMDQARSFCHLTLVPVRPRSRGERRSLRILLPERRFSPPTPRFQSPTNLDAFQLRF